MKWQESYARTQWDPYQLRPDFVRALHRLDDGRLRLRWSMREQQWAVERKVACGVSYVPSRLPVFRRYDVGRQHIHYIENDSWVRARDGVILIDLVPPQPQPGQWLITNLEYWWIPRWLGNYSHVADKVEDEDVEIAKRKERSHQQRLRDIGENTYEDYLWEGHRAAVPANYQREA